jgi:hypothetical protein
MVLRRHCRCFGVVDRQPCHVLKPLRLTGLGHSESTGTKIDLVPRVRHDHHDAILV